MTDARVGAWIAAWDNLNAANNSLKKYPIRDPDEYRAYCQMNAEIYAALADVPPEVGVAAAEVMRMREEQAREANEMLRKVFEK